MPRSLAPNYIGAKASKGLKREKLNTSQVQPYLSKAPAAPTIIDYQCISSPTRFDFEQRTIIRSHIRITTTQFIAQHRNGECL